MGGGIETGKSILGISIGVGKIKRKADFGIAAGRWNHQKGDDVTAASPKGQLSHEADSKKQSLDRRKRHNDGYISD